MLETEELKFDRVALEDHSYEYCKKELRLTYELIDTLRVAVSCAPIDAAPRVRRLVREADRLSRYFSKMSDALIESGRLVEAFSQAVLERLEDADEKMKALLQ